MAQTYDPIRHLVKFHRWPEQDQQAWARGMEPGDVFNDGGLGAAWSPFTKTKYIDDYGRWLTWWLKNGSGNADSPMDVRVTPVAVRDFITELQSLQKPRTTLGRVVGLYGAVRAMAPDHDWSWFKEIIRRLELQRPEPGAKLNRLVAARDLFSFGIRLMKEAEADAGVAKLWRVAEGFRNGLMIALLTARPVRRRNFTSIEIDRNLIRVGDGYVLQFEESETKAKRALEFPVPTTLVPWLERYLTVYRPVLCARPRKPSFTSRLADPGQALWISVTGNIYDHQTMSNMITRLTTAEFGKRINMHLFRDCVATSIAIEDPEHVRITAPVLGHSSLKTSEKYYNHAQGLVATDRYQTTIEALRKDAQSAVGTPPSIRLGKGGISLCG